MIRVRRDSETLVHDAAAALAEATASSTSAVVANATRAWS